MLTMAMASTCQSDRCEAERMRVCIEDTVGAPLLHEKRDVKQRRCMGG